MAHPLGVWLVHRETLATPIARTTETLKLVNDDVAMLVFKIPNAFEKFVTPQIAATHPFLLAYLPLDASLRRNSGVIGTRQPQHFLAILPRSAGENVLECIVQNMPKVQYSSNIRWWNHDRIPFLHGRWVSFKAFSGNPSSIPLGFNRLRFVGFR